VARRSFRFRNCPPRGAARFRARSAFTVQLNSDRVQLLKMSRRNWMGDSRMVHVSTPHESKQCGKFSDTFVSSFKSPSMGKHKRPVKRITSKKPLFELLDVGDDACHVKYLNSARPKKHVQRSRQAETESPDRFIYFGEASTPSAQTSNPQETQNVSRDLLALVGPTTRPPEAPRAAASASIAS
jgi:hypothetical protein